MRFALVSIIFFFSSFVFAAENTNDYDLPEVPLCDSEFYSELLESMNVNPSQEGMLVLLEDEFFFIPNEMPVQTKTEVKLEQSTLETASSEESNDGRRRNPKRPKKIPKKLQVEVVCVTKKPKNNNNNNVENNNVENNNVENFTNYDRHHFPERKDLLEVVKDWDDQTVQTYFDLPHSYTDFF